MGQEDHKNLGIILQSALGAVLLFALIVRFLAFVDSQPVEYQQGASPDETSLWEP